MADREIAYGVEEPGVYDGILYWVGTDGMAFQRFTSPHMRAKAQPFIDTFNAGAGVPRETSPALPHWCPDCAVEAGRPHDSGCDRARCTVCGTQRITCKHGDSDVGWHEIYVPRETSTD